METGTPEPFEDRVEALFEELELAIQWERPSILVGVYESEFVRQRAQDLLARRLTALGQRVASCQVDAGHFDVPLALAGDPGREDTVFFVSGLRWGGGKGGFEAYRALNLHREYFVEEKVRAVFWLTRSEAGVLPHHAPDFWAFRHRVIEFLDEPAGAAAPPPAPELAWPGMQPEELSAGVDEKIALRRALLGRLPPGDESQAARLDLVQALAGLYWAKGDHAGARALLVQALVIADRLGDPVLQARVWAGLGVVAQALGDKPGALSGCRKAVELDPEAAVAWTNLARLHLGGGDLEPALQAAVRATDLDPRLAGGWKALGEVHRQAGRLEEACRAYQHAARLEPQAASIWETLGLVQRDLGRGREAVRALSRSVRLDPGRVAAWKALGEVYQGQGRLREAARAYQKALEPGDAAARAALQACGPAAGRKQ